MNVMRLKTFPFGSSQKFFLTHMQTSNSSLCERIYFLFYFLNLMKTKHYVRNVNLSIDKGSPLSRAWKLKRKEDATFPSNSCLSTVLINISLFRSERKEMFLLSQTAYVQLKTQNPNNRKKMDPEY